MTNDDLIFRHRVQLFARAGEVGVSQACRELGFSRSTYYRWLPLVERNGLEILRPRERRKPRMPNQIAPWLEQRIVTMALGNPGLGPRRLAAQLALPQWGGTKVSATGVLNTLHRHGLHTRQRRLSLVAGYASPPPLPERESEEPRHLEANEPGELVQLDCFYIGRLSGTNGRIWQYTAIDVASSYLWASVHPSDVNPDVKHTSALVRQVADELSAAGWKLKAVTTDNGSEFRSEIFANAVSRRGAKHRRIRAGRPQTNGAVERVQRTILEECWKPTFARSLVPRYTALRRDLEAYVVYYNTQRAHTGRHNKGKTPAELVFGARKVYS